jgi:hypothetical protein
METSRYPSSEPLSVVRLTGEVVAGMRGTWSASVGTQATAAIGKGTALMVDGTVVPARDHVIAEQSKNYRYSTNHQVIIDADSRLVLVVGHPVPGNRNDCAVWPECSAGAAVGKTTTIADCGHPGTGLVLPPHSAPPAGGALCGGRRELVQAPFWPTVGLPLRAGPRCCISQGKPQFQRNQAIAAASRSSSAARSQAGPGSAWKSQGTITGWAPSRF